MTHADTLRGMAKAFTMVGSYEQADTCLAGAEALDTLKRVRNTLISIACERADTQYARGHDDDAEWYVATADALEYVVDLLTEALKGDLE